MSEDRTKNPPKIEITEEARKEVAELVESGIRALSDQMRQITKEAKEFDREFREAQRRIRSGSRRTTGRIV